jgi:glutamate-1-semialdehyde 2,1-aminomutase
MAAAGKVIAIVQARMGSTRLPGKVMRPLGGAPMIERLLERLARARSLDGIWLATSDARADDALAAHVAALGYPVFRGSEADVLSRFHGAATQAGATAVLRVTGDCPLVDPGLVDAVVGDFLSGGADYVSNVAPPSYPDGLDLEVFSAEALATAMADARAPAEREHVTPYLRESGRFRTRNIAHAEDLSGLRWTVDEPGDFAVVERVFAHFAPRSDFDWGEVLALQRADPALFGDNRLLRRNEGATMGSGQKLWKRARRIIPGGSMLLSKRAEMFLPEQWPAYFSKASGCSVWDLDGRRFEDLSLMGIGTNTLGYGHPEVDAAVQATVAAGNMSTLNCPEEVWLAERLLELHPWAEMARFARSGGEANAIAIRIARAASGRDKVAVCGYHGWHDWYLSANLGSDESLAGHLLPGLEPRGVPQNLRDTVFPFNYNDLEGLCAIVAAHDIGVIKMEVSRNQGPAPGFLEGVRALADDKGIVLVFDECTSGFRETFGGLHLKYGVEPDIALFGKTLGNGYAITATIGRREVMEAAQSTFISSTFWTERIGPSAALKALEVMARLRSWDAITATGCEIRAGWTRLAAKQGLAISHWGLPSLAGYTFAGDKSLEYKTLVTQEMLERGFLAGTSVYACIAHTPEVLERYFAALEPAFALVAECEHGGRDVMSLLKGPVCHAGFKRLN